MFFKDLLLIEPLLKALQAEGYEKPTPIQAQAIPIVLKERDLLGCAQTGTGKTAAFSLPILQLLHQRGIHSTGRRPIRTLILTPTRELAIQIGESLAAYGRNTKIRHTVIFGGVGQTPQTDALQRGVDILVATPGRLIDLMHQGFVSLRELEIFVLDEADRMLDMGFIHDVKKVIAKIPEQRQTLFFSATMPPEIAKLADSILKDPIRVEVTPVSSTAEKVAQSVYFVAKSEKKNLLIHLLKNPDIQSVLVFTRTKHGADRLSRDLTRSGTRAEAIHGNKSQNARQDALRNFKNGKVRVLVATDIAARGIDIDDLSHVVNYELPNIPETYVHRIGRTGRAGASGEAISFCEAEELPYLKDIQKLTGILVPVVSDHPYALDLVAPTLAPPQLSKKQKAQQKITVPQSRPEPAPPRPDILPLPPQRAPKPETLDKPRQKQNHPSREQRPAAESNRQQQPQQRREEQPNKERQPQGRPQEQQRPARREENRSQQRPPRREDERPEQQRPARREENRSQQRPPRREDERPERNEQQNGNRSRFSSILAVSAIEKQDFQRKPKPRNFDTPENSEPKNKGGGGFDNRKNRRRR